MWVLRQLLILSIVLLSASAAWAQPLAMPEVLLVVDTSQSMQYKVGSDTLPLCGSADPTHPDEKSRWTVLREIVGGTFGGYRCVSESLPLMSEAVSPPTQLYGLPSCIPGLGMTLTTPYVTRPMLSNGMASRVFPTSPSGPDDSAASYQTTFSGGTYTARTMWMEFDITDVPQSANWAGASVDIPGNLLNLQITSAPVQLVLSPYNPPTAGVDLCGIMQSTQTVLTGAVQLPSTGGSFQAMTLSLPLTDDGAHMLQVMRQGGTTTVSVALVPAGATFDSACTSSMGDRDHNVQFVPSSTSPNSQYSPTLTVATGVPCPSEGPTKHSIAQATQADGTWDSVPTGMDGIVDVFGQNAKFALLAGDNALNKGTTANAGFSFADEISSIWGAINLGLADPYLPGTVSVPVTRLETLAARAATYHAIQDSLKALRPNGPTPLGAAMTDLLAYIGPGDYADPHFRTQAVDPVNADPYGACRQKIAVILTDGGGNLYNGTSDGRATAVQSVATLFAAGIPVYVLAVGFAAETTATNADWLFLNDIAVAGGTQYPRLINTPQQAVAELSPVIDAAALNGLVLTRPAYTTSTGSVDVVQHSFQAISIFDLSQPLRTRGIVEQRLFKCDGACKSDAQPNRAQVCGIINYSDRLKARSFPRRLYTHTSGTRVPLTSAQLSPADLGIATVGQLPRLQLESDTSCSTSGIYDLSDPVQRASYRDDVIATLRGDTGTCRQNHPLGAPSRAQPALLEPASRLPIRDPSFRTYVSTPTPTSGSFTQSNFPGSLHRPTMLFVATHDGLLHAFRTDQDSTITTQDALTAGDEMWAFLPRFSLTRISQIKLVTSPDASYLNSPITAEHILMQRDVSGGATTATTAQNWRAVVVAGAGESGSGYVALDVTAPEDPQVLWEITPDRHCFGLTTVGSISGPRCVATTKYGSMGRSTARPVITTLFFTNTSGVTAERSVAIIPFGKPPGDSSVANLGVEGAGDRGIYIVDMQNGDLLRQLTTDDLVATGAPFTLSDPTLIGNFWTEPACYNNAAGQVTTRCFIGDSKGVVWRIDLSALAPADWSVHYFFDLYKGTSLPTSTQFALNSANRVPITSPPSLSKMQNGALAVVVGSGNGDIDTSTTKHDVVVSLQETYTFNQDGVANPPTAVLNWLKILGDGERFIGPPLVFAYYAYWASYVVAKVGLCEIGNTRLWGVRYDRRQTATDPQDTIGAFINPLTPSNVSSNLDYQAVGSYRPSPVDLQPEPGCISGCPPNNPACLIGKGASLGGGAPSYQLSVAVSGNVQSAYQTPKSNANGTASVGTIAITPPQPRTAAVITGWDLLLD